MHRGGGSAGGYSRKSNIEAVKHVPKFLENLKMQYVKKEAKLEDKFGGQWKNEFAEGNAKYEDYDLENAQVVDESGEALPDAMPEIMPDHRTNSNLSDSGKKKSNEHKSGTPVGPINHKIDLKEFHPTFKSKKPVKHEDVKSPEEHKQEKKEVKENKKEDTKPTQKNSKDLEDKNVNVKRGLDAYVKDYVKDEKEKEVKNKKVKTNLLSFDENE